jgi:hypothetical protein
MKRLLPLVFLAVVGCSQGPVVSQSPEISVERVESAGRGGAITINYLGHLTRAEPDDTIRRTDCWVRLETPEEVARYRKQLSFALEQLDAVHKKNEEIRSQAPKPPTK